jgi:SAM-dependent methyltransferase
MFTNRSLPSEFLDQLKSLEQSCLAENDPVRQSGFGGGSRRWRAEREPILNAIESNADLLDIGCANGYLLECLITWARERRITLTPFGLDISPKLIELARNRLTEYKSNFFVGNAWDWGPPRSFQYVYTVYDCVPAGFLEEYIYRLLARAVEPGGRLIVGAYGSGSRGIAPFDIAGFLESRGFTVFGTAQGGDLPVTSFAWIDRP